MLSLTELSKKYNCPHYSSISDLLVDPEVGPLIDGAIISTSHSSHYTVGTALLQEGIHRRKMAEAIEREEEGSATSGKKRKVHTTVCHRAINILMEKPMTTSVDEANKLWEMSTLTYPEGAFVINHTASYRPQTEVARRIIASDQIGKIRHISASMNGPLMWLFDDVKNEAWVSKSASMAGNGYAWGQIAHLLAWIYTVLGTGINTSDGSGDAKVDIATPTNVYCTMTYAPNTGADASFAAVITCRDGVTFSLNGTALLPGSQYADPPVGKLIRVEMYGTNGSLMYGGDDKIPESGRMELRRSVVGKEEDGRLEYPCAHEKIMEDGFYFEDGNQDGNGPGSMKAFLEACRTSSTKFERSLSDREERSNASTAIVREESIVNDSLIGLRTVQIIDAMYRSALSGNAELIKKA
eukprot:scaffold25_cov190-Alexandrium_tamarense.AAC.12